MAVPEEAVALKEKGNAAFKAHDWLGAVSFYTQAIEAYDKEPSFYTNRAQVSSRHGGSRHAT
jgi:serine/threonine-protein phosphatase 5